MSLLPSHHDEFRSRAYWDNFFRERGNEAFEWYGSFAELRAQTISFLGSRKDTSCLVIGCGNSEFSSGLYAEGFHNVRNLDFSPEVIDEMRVKHSTLRPEMLWDLGDMTCMTDYSDECFDVVFDKGALDALMSVDTEEVRITSLL